MKIERIKESKKLPPTIDHNVLVNGHLKIRTFSKLGGKSAPLATVPVTTRIMSNASERDNMRNQARSMADLEKMTIYYFAFIGYG